MSSSVKTAQRAARKAIESTYDGIMSVMEMQKIKDEKTKLTKTEPVVVLDEVPCRISFSSISAAGQSDSAAAIAQTVKMFVSPDINIKAGSKISVTQNGVTTDYAQSGAAAVYATHQEIMLELFERWS